MRPAEFRELIARESAPPLVPLGVIETLADLWEAAEKTRLERFHSVPGKGEAEMHAVLRRLGDL